MSGVRFTCYACYEQPIKNVFLRDNFLQMLKLLYVTLSFDL